MDINISWWFPWFSNQMFTRLQIPSQWWTSNGAFRAIGLGGDSIIGKLAPGEWGRQCSKVVEPCALIAKGGTGHGTPPASRDWNPNSLTALTVGNSTYDITWYFTWHFFTMKHDETWRKSLRLRLQVKPKGVVGQSFRSWHPMSPLSPIRSYLWMIVSDDGTNMRMIMI